jgi:hypothetical protein
LAVGVRVTAMTTSREYRQFARECTKWADETDTNEARKAFLDLARDWSFAALTVDRIEKKQPSAEHRYHRENPRIGEAPTVLIARSACS